MLIDFTNIEHLNNWIEVSDSTCHIGTSKATITLIQSHEFQYAVFFTLLHPQANGAGFAGMRVRTDLDLTRYCYIEMLCRAHGANKTYKMVLQHRDERAGEEVTYGQFFSVRNTRLLIILFTN